MSDKLDAGCYICQPGNPNAADEGCGACDSDFFQSVMRQHLAHAAAWVAESIGYPIEVSVPERQMPQVLWDALVDHVHIDETGKWHGNTLDRDETESWLADEAGRTTTAREGQTETNEGARNA